MTALTCEVTSLTIRYAEDKQLETPVTIPPHLLRHNLALVIQDILNKKIRGRCTAKDGFVIKLKRLVAVEGGSIEQRTGAVNYTVRYVAQCLRPLASHVECDLPSCTHSGDIVEAFVSRIMKIGVFADLGPLSIFVPASHFPPDFVYENNQFFSEEKNFHIRQQSLIRIRIEHIDMLDDNYLPSNTTSCVLKAMGTFLP